MIYYDFLQQILNLIQSEQNLIQSAKYSLYMEIYCISHV